MVILNVAETKFKQRVCFISMCTCVKTVAMFLSLRRLSATGGSKVPQGDVSPLPLCPLSRLPKKKNKKKRPQLGIPVSNGHPNPIKQTHYVKKISSRSGVCIFSSRKCTWPTDKLAQDETFMMRTGYLFTECSLSALHGLTGHYPAAASCPYVCAAVGMCVWCLSYVYLRVIGFL